MKKTILFINLVLGLICSAYSQETTNYGVGTPSVGLKNSFFGYRAGLNMTTGYRNSFFGSNSGKNTTTGRHNVAIGAEAFLYNSAGYHNTAVGYAALQNNTANFNTAVGSAALASNVSGFQNVAVGLNALYDNNAEHNTAVGANALANNTNGTDNVAIGALAMYEHVGGGANTAMGGYVMYQSESGNHNTGIGYRTLYINSADRNTAVGSETLYNNTTGNYNTGEGFRALHLNSVGFHNTALGAESLYSNVSGNYNLATGYYSLRANTTGIRNAAVGYYSLYTNTTGSQNTANGAFALDAITTGSFNTAVGYDAGPATGDLNNTTALGYMAVPTASHQVRIGNTSITSIGGQVGWTEFSDGRFKKNIKEDVSGLEFISQLRPVSYTVDKEKLNEFLHVRDSSSNQTEAKSIPVRKTGFIAQEVEALIKKTGYVFSGVDAPDNENDPYGIRYSGFVVPLVKAVQELSARVQLLLAERETENEKSAPGTRASLFQNNPNPFDAETEIKMTLPDQVSTATVMVYNLEGKQLKNIQVSERGDVKVRITANELSAGMYLYTLIADGKVVDTKRMVLTK